MPQTPATINEEAINLHKSRSVQLHIDKTTAYGLKYRCWTHAV